MEKQRFRSSQVTDEHIRAAIGIRIFDSYGLIVASVFYGTTHHRGPGIRPCSLQLQVDDDAELKMLLDRIDRVMGAKRNSRHRVDGPEPSSNPENP